MCSCGINCMGVGVTELTRVGVCKHIWRVSCGLGVFGNSLRSAASVDFIILLAERGDILKAQIYVIQKQRGRQESDPKLAVVTNRCTTTDGQSPSFARYLGTDVCTCGH